jgi:2-keto-4-pentenoate hydratase
VTPEEIRRWAERLAEAAEWAIPIEPVTSVVPDLDVAQAYAIQSIGVERRVAAGRRVVGHKIGLTAKAVQRQLGVDVPDYGALLDDMVVSDGGSIDRGSLIAPRVEVEVAFVLGSPLRGPGITEDDVLAAVSHVTAAIEIVDSRIADWRITLGDTIADNASSGALVLGTPRAAADVDIGALGARLVRGGELVEEGTTAAVLGHPATAVTWLANALGELGTSLPAGAIVLSGAATRMVDAAAGDHFVAELDELGSVSVSFTKGTA